jgi:hypothetical protein
MGFLHKNHDGRRVAQFVCRDNKLIRLPARLILQRWPRWARSEDFRSTGAKGCDAAPTLQPTKNGLDTVASRVVADGVLTPVSDHLFGSRQAVSPGGSSGVVADLACGQADLQRATSASMVAVQPVPGPPSQPPTLILAPVNSGARITLAGQPWDSRRVLILAVCSELVRVLQLQPDRPFL